MSHAHDDKVIEMGLCEVAHIVLKPNQLYRFKVMPGCPKCQAIAELSCPECAGMGGVDSGGVTPEGAGITLPCPACGTPDDLLSLATQVQQKFYAHELSRNSLLKRVLTAMIDHGVDINLEAELSQQPSNVLRNMVVDALKAAVSGKELECEVLRNQVQEYAARMLKWSESPAGDLAATRMKLETANRLVDDLTNELDRKERPLEEQGATCLKLTPEVDIDYLLLVAAEECAEIAQRVMKASRFGLDDVQAGHLLSNAERIMHEYADLVAVVRLLQEARALPELDKARIAAKQKKVAVYLPSHQAPEKDKAP